MLSLTALLSPLSSPLWAASSADSPIHDSVLGTERKFSAWAYGRSFADRFDLPVLQDESLPNEIEAMEFRVQYRVLDAGASFYDCQLHVYLNNKLDILYPEGDVGSRDTLTLGDRGLISKMPNPEDRLFHWRETRKYLNKANFLATRDKMPSFGGSVPITNYRKYFLPDVAYLAYSVGCGYVVNPDEYKFSLWIKKRGDPKESGGKKEAVSDPAHGFYQFHIPQSFVERFYPPARKAAKENSARIATDNKAR